MSTGEHANQEDSDEPRRLEIPGRAAIHDKRTTRGRLPDGVAAYKCPWCPFTDPNERTVRLHITTEDSGHHRARNAFRDQVCVHAIDADGNHIEDISTRNSGMTEFEGEHVIEFLPEGVDPDSRAGQIIETALRYPGKSAQGIAESVYDGAAAEPNPAYVRTVLQKHLGKPDMATAASNQPDQDEQQKRSYSRLTDLRKAVVDARAAHPDFTNKQIVEECEIDTHPDYISTLKREFSDLIDHRRAMIEAGTLTESDLAFNGAPEPEPKTDDEDQMDQPLHRKYSDIDHSALDPEEIDVESWLEDRTENQREFLREYISDPFRQVTVIEETCGRHSGYAKRLFELYPEPVEALYQKYVVAGEDESELTNGDLEVDITDQEETADDDDEEEPEPEPITAGAKPPADPADTTPPDHSTVSLSNSQWIEVVRLVSADAGEDLLTDLVTQID